MESENCLEYLVPLVALSVAFVSLLTINIVHCAKNRRKGKEMKYYSQCTISYDQQCIENNPIYGNWNHQILEHTEECCYEPMSNTPERNTEVQLEFAEQTCYAALDLSPKRVGKNRRMKSKSVSHSNVPASQNGKLLSRSSIYLNSEQLTEACRAEEDLVHDDPVRVYHLLQKTKNKETEDEDYHNNWPEEDIL